MHYIEGQCFLRPLRRKCSVLSLFGRQLFLITVPVSRSKYCFLPTSSIKQSRSLNPFCLTRTFAYEGILFVDILINVYSMIRQRGRCSCKQSNSSRDVPGQLVSSNSCKCRSCIRLDKPLLVSNGQPATDNTCRDLMTHKC